MDLIGDGFGFFLTLIFCILLFVGFVIVMASCRFCSLNHHRQKKYCLTNHLSASTLQMTNYVRHTSIALPHTDAELTELPCPTGALVTPGPIVHAELGDEHLANQQLKKQGSSFYKRRHRPAREDKCVNTDITGEDPTRSPRHGVGGGQASPGVVGGGGHASPGRASADYPVILYNFRYPGVRNDKNDGDIEIVI